MNHEVIL